ncbi:hypothetical protein BKL49_04980 [Rodentibacter myodis]|uniref:Uncharacterized protein n=2 Tax=Rodentibacter myodis TaxID=1907939 RepID=A0A1V3JQ19_9PAST|nr:hypothetical protein BKL49_04980 [Rodentibacter myodis]
MHKIDFFNAKISLQYAAENSRALLREYAKRSMFCLGWFFAGRGIFTLPWWLTPKWAERLANTFLMPEYSLQLSQTWTINHKGWQIP